jgi:hypothetical protein
MKAKWFYFHINDRMVGGSTTPTTLKASAYMLRLAVLIESIDWSSTRVTELTVNGVAVAIQDSPYDHLV